MRKKLKEFLHDWKDPPRIKSSSEEYMNDFEKIKNFFVTLKNQSLSYRLIWIGRIFFWVIIVLSAIVGLFIK